MLYTSLPVRFGIGNRAGDDALRYHTGYSVAAANPTRADGPAAPSDPTVALFGEDRVRAEAFVENELGRLEANTARCERLLRTLEVYLQHGQRIANASVISGRHRDTVHRHLHEIEELLGFRIEQRSAELLLALRLRRAYGIGVSS